MNIIKARYSDADRLYEIFQSVSVTRKDLQKKPASGFYEYPLEWSDFNTRLKESDISLILEKDKKIIAYILAYPLCAIPEITKTHTDPVLDILPQKTDQVYLDQLFMQPNMPAYVIGRLFDTWNSMLRNEKISEVYGAIPTEPWTNQASLRFATHHGFKKIDTVKDKDITLNIMSKIYWDIGKEIEYQ